MYGNGDMHGNRLENTQYCCDNYTIAKLSFNFNFNSTLVESWDSINFIFNTHPPTRRKSLKIHIYLT